ncbi:unnamed protein product [Penicillium nalgiovense]|nr:unnamed protein product [Penicillium nalgiovense]
MVLFRTPNLAPLHLLNSGLGVTMAGLSSDICFSFLIPPFPPATYSCLQPPTISRGKLTLIILLPLKLKMSLSDRDLHFRPMPRSREENQERAFIAASRRKDRSLDARVKSANRASSLHKRRTGRAFHITKEIVEEEDMYEEVDERYQAKRILMLQNQTLQIKEQSYRHLLAGFPGRPILHSKGPSIASRRASNLAFHPSTKGNLQKLSLDLSSINSSASLGVAALATTQRFLLLYQAYHSFATTCGKMPNYVKQTSAPAWSTAAIQHQQTPASDQPLRTSVRCKSGSDRYCTKPGRPSTPPPSCCSPGNASHLPQSYLRSTRLRPSVDPLRLYLTSR